MSASKQRGVIFVMVWITGYAIGFYDGSVGWFLGPLLLITLAIGKLTSSLLRRLRIFRGGDSGPGDAPYSLVPRGPTTRPPVLRGRQGLPV